VAVLRISEATAGYGKTLIIRDVELEVGDGEMVALLGRNGVGKTTLMKYVMGLLAGARGTVELAGASLPPAPARRARAGLGYVPQGRRVFPRLTVAENITAAAVACGRSGTEMLAEVFTEFPILAARESQLAGSLSGGQQQILAIGRALATAPKVLLLDEPTEGVQPSIIDDIGQILERLHRERGLSVLLAEQNLDFAMSLTSRCYVMDKGTIARRASREELLRDKALLHELLGV
jgi:branched-chain amino acid transport system ATP-binding protein/urea transport system ATP-binding protein